MNRFVTYANKTEAATAVEMFAEYKIGGKYLSVKHNNNSSSGGFRSSSISSTSRQARSLSTPSRSDDIEKPVEKKPPQTASVVTSPSEDDIWSEIDKSPKMRQTPNSFNEDSIVDKNNNTMGVTECNSTGGSRLTRAPVGRGALLRCQENKQVPSRRKIALKLNEYS